VHSSQRARSFPPGNGRRKRDKDRTIEQRKATAINRRLRHLPLERFNWLCKERAFICQRLVARWTAETRGACTGQLRTKDGRLWRITSGNFDLDLRSSAWVHNDVTCIVDTAEWCRVACVKNTEVVVSRGCINTHIMVGRIVEVTLQSFRSNTADHQLQLQYPVY
jgi:hypothetical protein